MKDKSAYIVSKSMIVGIIVLVASIVLILLGFKNNRTINNAVPYENLNAQNLQDGQYVTCIVDSYLVKKVPFSASYNGVLQATMDGTKEYVSYLSFLPDGKLIRINMYSTENKYVLRQYEYDDMDTEEPFKYASGERILFTGIVKAAAGSDAWYKDIEDFDTSLVVPTYEITEIAEKKAMNLQYIGFVGLLIAALCLTRSAKVEKATPHKAVDYKGIYTNQRQSETPKTPYYSPVNIAWEKAKAEKEAEEAAAAGTEEKAAEKPAEETVEDDVDRPKIGDAPVEEVKPAKSAAEPVKKTLAEEIDEELAKPVTAFIEDPAEKAEVPAEEKAEATAESKADKPEEA